MLLLPALDLRPADFSGLNQRVDTGLRQFMAVAVHAQTESFCLEPILAAIFLVVLAAIFLHGVAIGQRERRPGESDGKDENSKSFHGAMTFAKEVGSGGGTRTPDTRIMIPLL
jgi:hypothetical protein